jgi:hypothetical protein
LVPGSSTPVADVIHLELTNSGTDPDRHGGMVLIEVGRVVPDEPRLTRKVTLPSDSSTFFAPRAGRLQLFDGDRIVFIRMKAGANFSEYGKAPSDYEN